MLVLNEGLEILLKRLEDDPESLVNDYRLTNLIAEASHETRTFSKEEIKKAKEAIRKINRIKFTREVLHTIVTPLPARAEKVSLIGTQMSLGLNTPNPYQSTVGHDKVYTHRSYP